MELKIKLDVPDKVLDTINLFASALAHANGMTNTVKALEEIREEKTEKIEETKEVVEDKAEEEIKAEAGPTREDVRAKFISKRTASNKDDLRGILTKYGANNISTLAEEHFAAAIKDLEALA